MNAPKHAADQSAATRVREKNAAFLAEYGIWHEGLGKHRAANIMAATETEAEVAA